MKLYNNIIETAQSQGWKIHANPVGQTQEFEWVLFFTTKVGKKEFKLIASEEYFSYELGEIFQAFDPMEESHRSKYFISKLSFGEILHEFTTIDTALRKLLETLE